MPAKRLIIFDLDGVILNSRENMRHSWGRATAAAGVSVPFDDYFREIGRPFGEIMARLGLAARAAALESAFRIASMERLDLLSFYDGVEATLRRLAAAGTKLGIVTSKDKMRTNAIVAMLPVDFACVLAPDGQMRGKPAPDHLLFAMAQTGTDPADTLYVGDMVSDHEAARRARIDYAHADWGYGPAPGDGSRILARMTDLLDFVADPAAGEAAR